MGVKRRTREELTRKGVAPTSMQQPDRSQLEGTKYSRQERKQIQPDLPFSLAIDAPPPSGVNLAFSPSLSLDGGTIH